MIINFNKGKKVDYINATETEEYFNGTSRRTLTFECNKNAISIDELNTILSDENNTKKIVLEGDVLEDGTVPTSINEGYVLKLKVGVEPVLVSSETPETPAKFEDRILFKLGKRTYIEEQLKKLGL